MLLANCRFLKRIWNCHIKVFSVLICCSLTIWSVDEIVQDSKFHKGELFGISNLFKDLLEKVFTSEIIENYDERVAIINQKGTIPNTSKLKILEEQTVGHPEELWGGNIHDLVEQNGPRGQIVPTPADSIENDSETSATQEWRSESDAEDFDEIRSDSEEQYKNLLKDSGNNFYEYAHHMYVLIVEC